MVPSNFSSVFKLSHCPTAQRTNEQKRKLNWKLQHLFGYSPSNARLGKEAAPELTDAPAPAPGCSCSAGPTVQVMLWLPLQTSSPLPSPDRPFSSWRDIPSWTNFFKPIPAQIPPKLLCLWDPLNKKNKDKTVHFLCKINVYLNSNWRSSPEVFTFTQRSPIKVMSSTRVTKWSLICSLVLLYMVKMRHFYSVIKTDRSVREAVS